MKPVAVELPAYFVVFSRRLKILVTKPLLAQVQMCVYL